MFKHAWLVMAHNNFEQLNYLLQQLDFECNSIYLHVDIKAKNFRPENLFTPKKASLKILENRRNIAWGGNTQILLEYELLQAACLDDKHDYYHLISGVDLLIKPFKAFDEFIREHNKTQFIGFQADVPYSVIQKRIDVYWPLQNICGRGKTPFTFILRVINICLAKFQKIIGVHRNHHPQDYWAKGANWFSISDELARYILSQKEWIDTSFKYSFCADELFLQTLVKNSPFADSVYKKDSPSENNNLRYIDWGRGNPYTFKSGDLEILKNCGDGFFIARKFDWNTDSEIIKNIVSLTI